jgi:signal peptidase I
MAKNSVMMPEPEQARGWAKTAADFLIVLLVVVVGKTAIAEPYYVPSGSMEPTLLIGDELLAMKYPYGYSSASLPLSIVIPTTHRILGAVPKRGDVVVFRWPGDLSQIWVKRVIGLPGDRIQVRDGRLWINGARVGLKPGQTARAETSDGSFIPATRFIETLPGGREHAIFKLTDTGLLNNTPEVVVPPGDVFVMGDNRDNSADSRVPVAMGGVGLLPIANLVGRVDALVGSWDLGIRRQPIWQWPSGLRFTRFFTAVH